MSSRSLYDNSNGNAILNQKVEKEKGKKEKKKKRKKKEKSPEVRGRDGERMLSSRCI